VALKSALSALLRMLGFSTHEPTAVQRWPRPTIILERWAGPDRPPPLTWKECNPRTRIIFKAELTCANGHGVSLRGHSIAPDGTVSPSVVCLERKCDFHDFVRLDGWSGGALR
jgi:hypothetical protein